MLELLLRSDLFFKLRVKLLKVEVNALEHVVVLENDVFELIILVEEHQAFLLLLRQIVRQIQLEKAA